MNGVTSPVLMAENKWVTGLFHPYKWSYNTTYNYYLPTLKVLSIRPIFSLILITLSRTLTLHFYTWGFASSVRLCGHIILKKAWQHVLLMTYITDIVVALVWVLTLRIQGFPIRKGLTLQYLQSYVLWGWDWDHQSYEKSGGVWILTLTCHLFARTKTIH